MQQRCPRCKSDRIRHGYRHTPLLLKLVFRYHLLCDSCNWEFTGFAVPGTVSTRTRKKKDKPAPPADSNIQPVSQDAENIEDSEQEVAMDVSKEEVGDGYTDTSDTEDADASPLETESQIIKADEKAKKKKVKKRVKVRLN